MARGRGGFIGQDGLNAPDSPTSVSASAGDTQATVSFTAPTDVGGSAITGFRAQSNTGVGASGSSSPITVTGLSNGTSYTFNVWAINAFGYSAPSDASGSVSPVAPQGRAIFVLGTGSATNNYNYVDIVSSGNASVFGNLNQAAYYTGGFSSSTRSITFGGYASSAWQNWMEYVTIASTGNGTDFGDLTQGTRYCSGVSSNTRGVRTGGQITGSNYSNVMDYVTIASTGNAQDFGDLTAYRGINGGAESTTRGIVFGGAQAGSNYTDVIDYITIANTGNATDFGDLSENLGYGGAASSSTRAVAMFTYGTSGNNNKMEYVTIASTGNSTDFGDLTFVSAASWPCATSNKIKALIVSANNNNVIQQLTIATTGNTTDYGDLTDSAYGGGATSDSHGGLS